MVFRRGSADKLPPLPPLPEPGCWPLPEGPSDAVSGAGLSRVGDSFAILMSFLRRAIPSPPTQQLTETMCLITLWERPGRRRLLVFSGFPRLFVFLFLC